MKWLPSPYAKLQVAFLGLCTCVFANTARAAGYPSGADDRNSDSAIAMSRGAPKETVSVPGPLRSFLRIAGISQQAAPADVLALLARKVYQDGYAARMPTEYLRLLQRYVSQARELEVLAGSGHTLRVVDCDGAAPLIHLLGYKLRHGCGREASLETVNPERAFLTIDSGFPLTDLEEALQRGVPFTYPYPSSSLPALFGTTDWLALNAGSNTPFNNGLDLLLRDQTVARLYWGLSRIDAETRSYLQQSLGLHFLLAATPAIDFYGGQICIRQGRVLVPGGPGAEPAWKDLVGASPGAPANFVAHLFRKDDGWLATYFDVLSRLDAEEQQHLTRADRLLRYYAAFRTADTRSSAWNGVVRPASELLVLDTRLRWESNGDPHVPGGLQVWKDLLQESSSDRISRNWARRAQSLTGPDQLIEALTALSRVVTETGLLQLYLTALELDRRRPADRPVSAETVKLMAGDYPRLSHWLSLFSEFPGLSDDSIGRFLQTAEVVDALKDQAIRANAMGAFQANIGIWQVLARQGEIPGAELNESWEETVGPFAKVASSAQVFDAARGSLQHLLLASGAGPNSPPSEIIDRLAGPVQTSVEGQRVHEELAARLRSVLEDQRLVSLDTLFALSDGLGNMSRTGVKGGDDLLSLAGELREFDLPRPIFTNQEKITWAPAVYVSRHAELQVRTDLSKIIRTSGTHAQLEAARGQLTPFLRDTLVGLNYAYYEPPGAQVLHVNPLFVRAHDFLGVSVIGSNRTWQQPVLLGAGVSAGGGAYLMGSLADLPYSLASVEQDFIVPENVQALVWKELVPGLMAGALLPRWWSVSPDELHAVALYQRSGEEVLHAAAHDAKVRTRVIQIFADRLSPARLEEIEQSFPDQINVAATASPLMSSETYYLGEAYRKQYPEDAADSGPGGRELAALAQRSPAAVDVQRISNDFGVPHPTLAQTNARELLSLQPFPFSVGYTSRLFGESLESCNLYWARLADEMGYPPVSLNRLVPELTRHMVGKIFATNIEDWPAVQRAMQQTGEDLRQNKIASLRSVSGKAVAEQTLGSQQVR